ncbi:carboxylesterase/lipase family protein [Brevundimonas sp.]|uniref:carboxylesterase/lipase family protein n=1 Tax=Brevundimonas sp. TaxID=1871086 RepID=UPI003D0F4B97
MTDYPLVETTSGPVRGIRMPSCARFLGIPYAAAPVGDRRFALPQPHARWTEPFDATRHGPTAPYQLAKFDALDLAPLVGEGWIKGDDYLNLNIWTPNETASGLPVLVFIHGGAWTGGSGAAPVHDGAAFARDGVVCVTINYRLGIDGFLPIPGVPTNLGLRDMIAALAWVQHEIAAFGGDPKNVTVAGESAGAMSIGDLVVSPMAKGLFRRAIIQSGHGSMVRSIETNRKVVARLARMLGVPATVEGFRTVSAQDGLNALDKVQQPGAKLDLRDARGREPAYGLSRFLPVFGDDVIPIPPLKALDQGAGAEVDVLIGSNLEEMSIYLVPTGAKKKINGLLAWFILSRVEPKAGRMLKAYRKKGRSAGDVLSDALTDLVFRWPARVFAARHKGRTHFYEMGWRSPAFDGELGACHAVEMPFVFDTLATGAGPKGFLGENPPQALADSIHKVWVDYARDGTAPWAEYEPGTRQVYRLDLGKAVRDPDVPAANLWRE